MTISQLYGVCSYRTKVLFCLIHQDLSLHPVVKASAVRRYSDAKWNKCESPAFEQGERPSSGSKARRRALRYTTRENPGGNGHEWNQSSYAIYVSSRTLTT